MADKKTTRAAASSTSAFGDNGKIKVRTNVDAALINVTAGEHIVITVSVTGGIPEFAFSCRDRGLWNAEDFEGHPKEKYQWAHFKKADDADRADDTYVLTFIFAGVAVPNALKYTYVLDHCDRLGAQIARLKDVDYSSTSANDFFHDGIRLFSR